MVKEGLLYEIALTFIPGIGDILAKSLISYCGSAEEVFKSTKSHLLKIPGIGIRAASAIVNHKAFDRAEKEIRFLERNSIQPLFYLNKEYPQRLGNCNDSPIMLYYKGNTNLNEVRMISMVGTRNASAYGRKMCTQLVEDLSPYSVVIVSGLAYGIDITTHKEAVKNNIQTVGVLGHSLDRLYPASHRSTAVEMVKCGGLLTEFPSETGPDKENFPKRNRIIAGISDAVIVVETGKKGGAMITAEIANSYNRDVFAIPGKINKSRMNGCNFLIKSHKASLIESVHDIEYLLGWEEKKNPVKAQRELMLDLSENEKKVIALLEEVSECHIDTICVKTGLMMSEAASILLNLEFMGVVITLPGKNYKIL